jgi:5-methylcytosine-specific restriction protein A
MPYKPTPKKNKLTAKETNKSWSGTDFKYNSSAWIKLRDFARTIYPLCVHCKEKGIIEPTKVIDHKKAIIDGGDPWDIENCQGLCEKCHRIKSSKEIINRQ